MQLNINYEKKYCKNFVIDFRYQKIYYPHTAQSRLGVVTPENFIGQCHFSDKYAFRADAYPRHQTEALDHELPLHSLAVLTFTGVVVAVCPGFRARRTNCGHGGR